MTVNYAEFVRMIEGDAGSASSVGPSLAGEINLSGSHATASCFSVSRFAQWSIAAAVSEVLQLRQQLWNAPGTASVDR